jgi:hypothetical protein
MSIDHRRIRRDVLLRVLIKALAIFAILSGQFLAISPAQAAKPVLPKVGDCYSLSLLGINAPTSNSKKVACSQPHTVETYRVTKWRGPANPATLSEVRRRVLAEQICMPWGKESTFFTNWSYKVPTSAQWRSGLRVIRCDAYKLSNDGIGVVERFTGSRIDFK